MRNFLCLSFAFMFSVLSTFASDVKFVQIDSLKFSPKSTESVNNFKNVIKEINKEKNLNFVVFTGDNIAKSNQKNLKAFLKKARGLKAPFYIALGHKDLNKRDGLSKTEYMKIAKSFSCKCGNTPNYTFSKKGLIFIVANGAKEFIPTPFGYYKDDVIEYLDAELTKNSKKNVVILQHFPINSPNENEAYRTYKAEEYFAMLKNHKNVIAIISGFGINSETDVDGIKHITTANYPQYRIIEIKDCTGSEPTIWSTLK